MALRVTKQFQWFLAIIAGALVIGGLYYAANHTNLLDNIMPKTGGTGSASSSDEKYTASGATYKIGINTWCGFAGGTYYNNGFTPNSGSRYKTDYGFDVEFVVLDDFPASRSAFIKGDVDVLFATVDAFPTEMDESGALAMCKPKIYFNCDISRGGDLIVARQGINTVADLKGKKVAVAEMTPSHSFFLWLLDAGGLTMKDIELVKVGNSIDAATMFKNQECDAAVVWSPDDQDCIKANPGSKVLESTKHATNIIYDVFMVKEDFMSKHKADLAKLYEGWIKGNVEINSSEDNKKKAADILAKGFNVDYSFAYNGINNARLCTHGDNLVFFSSEPTVMTGGKLYTEMSGRYKALGYVKDPAPWRSINDASIVNSANLNGPGQEAEGKKTFTKATDDLKTKKELSNKAITITFQTGVSQLDDNSKYIIDKEFVDIAKSFGGSRIRIEGNTDNTGAADMNKSLSYQRAKAVATYLIDKYKFDANRFIIIGNGSDKPVSDNGTTDGRSKNRRTDFELVNE